MTSYVALYCRISVDRAGRREGVRNQERWGRAYATERWPGLPVQVFVDNDLSAASGGPRPAFTALREAVRAGQVARLWAVEQSRLERTEVGWFELAAELDAAGIGEVHTLRDGIVRVTDEVAGIKAVLAAAEARKLRQRTRDKLASNAAAGIPPPSRPYGFRRVANEHGASTYEHDPEQARVVREVADKVLSGWSLTNIARHLTATGVRGAKGGVLNSTSVRSIVTTPAVAGLRVHQGRVVGRGNWAPILDEAAWRACCARLAAPRVVEQVDGTPYPVPAPGRSWARRYLLTRFAFCAVCGARLVGTLKQTRRRGASSPYYQCAPKYGGRACVGIKAEPTEAHVLGELMRKLATPAFVAALSDDGHSQRRDQLGAELDDVARQRGELAGLWATPGELTTDEWSAARAQLAIRERRLRAELAEVPPPLGDFDPAALSDPQVIEAMTLDERRELLGLFVVRVTVARAKPPYNRVDLSRISIEWRHRGG